MASSTMLAMRGASASARCTSSSVKSASACWRCAARRCRAAAPTAAARPRTPTRSRGGCPGSCCELFESTAARWRTRGRSCCAGRRCSRAARSPAPRRAPNAPGAICSTLRCVVGDHERGLRAAEHRADRRRSSASLSSSRSCTDSTRRSSSPSDLEAVGDQRPAAQPERQRRLRGEDPDQVLVLERRAAALHRVDRAERLAVEDEVVAQHLGELALEHRPEARRPATSRSCSTSPSERPSWSTTAGRLRRAGRRSRSPSLPSARRAARAASPPKSSRSALDPAWRSRIIASVSGGLAGGRDEARPDRLRDQLGLRPRLELAP